MKDMSQQRRGRHDDVRRLPDELQRGRERQPPADPENSGRRPAGDQKQLVRHVYDLALLSQNMLLGAELTNFIQRTVELTK
jgi:molecular chaperone HtpG